MENIISFVKNINIIIDSDTEFTKRKSDNNKLDFRSTLYASAITLRASGISSAASDLALNRITDVSKNALVKRRNNDTTHSCIKNVNDSIIKMFYDTSNNFIKPYSI